MPSRQSDPTTGMRVRATAARSLVATVAYLGGLIASLSIASPVRAQEAQHSGGDLGMSRVAIAEAPTSSPTTSEAGVRGQGIWVDGAELMQRPTAGVAWERLAADAARDHGRADIADQDSNHDVYTLAAALVCARVGEHCDKARQGILDAIGTEQDARWLAAGRNLGAYVIAADVLGMRADGVPGSDGTRVEAWVESWLSKELLENHSSERRSIQPFHSSSNAAVQEGFAFVAVAAYLRRADALERAWNAFRAFVCDAGASVEAHIDLESAVHEGWTDARHPCGVNPKGARKIVPTGLRGAGNIYSIDGALGGDMRRGGPFQARPGYTSLPWAGLEGLVPAAVILSRVGYPAFDVADSAILRTHEYLWQLRDATGEARWFDGTRAREIVQLVNAFYRTSYPVNDATGGGRTVGYTAWTHPTR